MYDLKNKSIIITGGSSGMGLEAALLAAKAGASITIADLNEDSGNQVVADIIATGGTAQFIKTDIANEDEVKAMVAKAVSAYGKLDGAFNNAAIPPAAMVLHEMDGATFRRALDINVTGTFLCMKYEIDEMLKTGGGAIVNTSSVAGVTAFPAAAEYITSKHAVLGLTKAGAVDYGTQGIRVNAIQPGATLTPMLLGSMAMTPGLEEYMKAQQPIGRLAEPHEIAAAAVWLLSDQASFVTGTCMAVDGGYTTI